MYFELQNELIDNIDRDERLLWVGKPKTGFILRGTDAILIPFSLLWFGFAVFWEFLALQTGSALFIAFGIPFVLIGFYICIGRFFADMLRRKNTVYGITNDRVIIKSGISRKEIRSVNIKSIAPLTFTEKKDGSGTILLALPDKNFVAFNTLSTWQGTKGLTGLELIPEVKKVYDILVKLQQE